MTKFGSLLFAVGLLWIGSVQAAADWSLARDRDGIKVWTRPVPGFPVHEFKAVTRIQSSLNGLVALVMDTDNAAKWIYRTEKIELLKRDDSQGYFLIRVVTNFPWPLTDRDAMIEGRITQDEKSGVVTIQSHALPLAKYPATEGLVRMTQMTGIWYFKPVGAGQVEVTMMGLADPAGALPSSAVNLLIHETPYRTLQGMRATVGAAVYQQTRAPQIKEVE